MGVQPTDKEGEFGDGRAVMSPPPPYPLGEPCGSVTFDWDGEMQVCQKDLGHVGWHETVWWCWSAMSTAAHRAIRYWLPAGFVEKARGVERAEERRV